MKYKNYTKEGLYLLLVHDMIKYLDTIYYDSLYFEYLK